MAVEVQQLERELRLKLGRDSALRRDAEDFADEVANRWVAIWEAMGPHPYATGDYADSIEVIRIGIVSRGRQPKGAPGGVGGRFTGKNLYRYQVGTQNEHAAAIEYGTGPDKEGGHATWIDLDGERHWGPYTPTEEFAPAAHTAAYYGGTGPD
jgi:hypothetical protein